jgi:hypothetical protein
VLFLGRIGSSKRLYHTHPFRLEISDRFSEEKNFKFYECCHNSQLQPGFSAAHSNQFVPYLQPFLSGPHPQVFHSESNTSFPVNSQNIMQFLNYKSTIFSNTSQETLKKLNIHRMLRK